MTDDTLPMTDERAAFEAWRETQAWYEVTKPRPGDEEGDGSMFRLMNIAASSAWNARASLASPAAPHPAQQAGQPEKWQIAQAPDKCPITRRPFFMALEHPVLGRVPTYGGPYDSYTIPHMDGEATQPFHERELACYRYDHDAGGWLMDVVESVPLRVIHEDVLNDLLDKVEQPDRAALPAQQAGDMVMVPREPTPEMIRRSVEDCGDMGAGSCGEYRGVDGDDMRAVWDAMLAAAPAIPAQQAGQPEDAELIEALEAFDAMLSNWTRAYPLAAFPEPDLVKAHEALTARGMKLDAVSASNMRHVVTVLDREFAKVRAAMSSPTAKKGEA